MRRRALQEWRWRPKNHLKNKKRKENTMQSISKIHLWKVRKWIWTKESSKPSPKQWKRNNSATCWVIMWTKSLIQNISQRCKNIWDKWKDKAIFQLEQNLFVQDQDIVSRPQSKRWFLRKQKVSSIRNCLLTLLSTRISKSQSRSNTKDQMVRLV